MVLDSASPSLRVSHQVFHCSSCSPCGNPRRLHDHGYELTLRSYVRCAPCVHCARQSRSCQVYFCHARLHTSDFMLPPSLRSLRAKRETIAKLSGLFLSRPTSYVRLYASSFSALSACETRDNREAVRSILQRPTSYVRLHASSFSAPSACTVRENHESVSSIFDKRQGQAYAHCGWT
jgi:hypothetical protein